MLYVYLVRIITEEKNWQQIQKRFEEFAKYSKINCPSLPIYTDDKNKFSSTIKHWLLEVERESLINSLEYNFLFETDISNCYSSIYTHSISWALHGKPHAKTHKFDKSLLGNQIDSIIRLISDSQTNGIPQGSILMDFIAEIVLFYLDREISVEIKNQEISDFKIIRWRDDYRVFAKNTEVLNKIKKIMTQEFLKLNFNMNSEKTTLHSDIVIGAFKKDKVDRIDRNLIFPKKYCYNTMVKFLVQLHIFTTKHKNSGSIVAVLNDIDKFGKIKTNNEKRIEVLIAVLVKILYENLKYFPNIIRIISVLLDEIKDLEIKKNIIKKIKNKFDSLLNIEYLEIWLQRLTIKTDMTDISYNSKLTELVSDDNNWFELLFGNDWLKGEIRKIIKEIPIIDKEKLEKLSFRIDKNEISRLFPY